MMFLQTWYSLSDPTIESMLNDQVFLMKFCVLQINDLAPDHTSATRYRHILVQQNILGKLLATINEQIAQKEFLINKGMIVDASITDSPYKELSTCKDKGDQEANSVKKGYKLDFAITFEYIMRKIKGSSP